MEKTTFLILFVLWVILISIKSPLLKLLQKNDMLTHVTQKEASYFMFFLLVVLIVVGMLFTSTTQTTFGNVSEGFEKVRNNPDNQKPHRYFNIDFDQIFPSGNE
jgi:cytochrome b561